MRYTGRENDRLISHESEEKGIARMRWTLVPIMEGFYKPLQTVLNEC
jgi:hypothetical protein